MEGFMNNDIKMFIFAFLIMVIIMGGSALIIW